MEKDERRRRERWRSRLRSGKLFDCGNRLLAECQIADMSDTGARLRLVVDRPLPLEVRLFDDAEETLVPVAIVWVKGDEVGIRFRNPEEDPILLSREQIGQLGRTAARNW